MPKIKKIKNKITLFFLVALLFVSMVDAKAQFESCKWIFGYGVGIDFISGHPLLLSGSKIKTSEGCSTLSDSEGNLLFYTDGISVWNKNNEIMPNGIGLNGHISSTQSAVIVPKPGSKSIYYIFTLDSEADKSGFSYTIVDLAKEQGLGDVTLKNQFVKNRCTERIAAIRHQNNNDIWIVIHEYDSDAFLSYLLTNNGLSLKPIISNIGIKHYKSKYSTIGYMKASPDKKKLAVAINGDRIVQLFDFDTKKGSIANPISIHFEANYTPYGLEFSPNGKLLYIGIETKGLVYQADLNAGDEASIQNSLCLIGKNKGNNFLGALQLGVDGKIYVAEYQSKFLSSIEHPDIQGTGCLFRLNGLSLKNSTCMFGLPTFFHDYVKVYKFNNNKLQFNADNKIELNRKYILNNVFFDFNKAELRNSSIIELEQLADYLQKNLKLRIEINGHTDSIGNVQYNNKLSIERATTIGNFLNDKGINSDRISCSGKGSSEPISSNADEEGRQQNRRVEFILKAF